MFEHNRTLIASGEGTERPKTPACLQNGGEIRRFALAFDEKLPWHRIGQALQTGFSTACYSDLLHESMHRTDPFWRRWLDSGDGPRTENHKGIYRRTAYEIGDRVDIDMSRTTSKDNIVPQFPIWGKHSSDTVLNSDARNPNNIRPDVERLYMMAQRRW